MDFAKIASFIIQQVIRQHSMQNMSTMNGVLPHAGTFQTFQFSKSLTLFANLKDHALCLAPNGNCMVFQKPIFLLRSNCGIHVQVILFRNWQTG